MAILAAIIMGIAKAGLKGMGVVIVTIMALVFGGRASTGIVVLLLIAADIMAVLYYTRHVQWKYLFRLLPWMIFGVLVGVWVGKDLPEAIFKKGMAAIIIFSVVAMYWNEKRPVKKVPNQWWFAGIMGSLAGFTTMIGNLAGAFTNIFFLAMRLPKEQFIGTAAWLFFVINLFKLPFHIFVWKTVTLETCMINLCLLPAVLLGFFLGIRLVKLIREKQYRQLILLLTALAAVLIFFR